MGRKIDRAVISIAAAFALYAVFVGATGSIFAAVIMTFISMCLMRKLLGRFSGRDPASARLRSARAVIERLSFSHDAEELLEKFLRDAYPEITGGMQLHFIIRHPSQRVTAEDIACICRTLHDCPAVCIAAIPPADAAAHALAARLRGPEIKLIDGEKLSSMMAARPDMVPHADVHFTEAPNGGRAHRVMEAASRAKWSKCALTGAFMCLLYFPTGAVSYLIGGCVLLFIAASAFRCRTVIQ